jgi:hypothetical protein
MMMFWRVTEDQQHARDALARELAEAEIERRRFASELLVNLARRNQSMLQRQMQIINQLEDTEQDPDVLGELFRLDHLTTRVRRNAENLLVLSGEQPPRTWSDPVGLRDVVRAAVAETEDLTRVVIDVDERPAVVGHVVTDLTHLLAELTENAVRFSPPDTSVTVRSRPGRDDAVGHVVVIEDWGVGIAADDLAETNALLAAPPDVDLAVHQRLGFHVVARLAARHGVGVVLQPTPGAGTTAVVTVPRALFVDGPVRPAALPRSAQRLERPDDATAALPAPSADWPGWWEGEAPPGAARPARGAPVATAERPAAPAQRPRPTPAPRAAAEPARTDPVSGLRVRVPQASLAAGLRTAPQAGGVEPARVDPTAASALSRYQANRQAAGSTGSWPSSSGPPPACGRRWSCRPTGSASPSPRASTRGWATSSRRPPRGSPAWPAAPPTCSATPRSPRPSWRWPGATSSSPPSAPGRASPCTPTGAATSA